MVGGICVRNFGAPRLSAAMVALSIGPCALGALFTHESILWLVLVQVPLYMTSMSMASYRLNDMLVSTMLARRENELHARQDSLTGLLNRHGLFGALDIAVRNAGHGQAEYAVLYLDLDGFKAVNDTYGHAAGDTLLTQVSARLVALCRRTRWPRASAATNSCCWPAACPRPKRANWANASLPRFPCPTIWTRTSR